MEKVMTRNSVLLRLALIVAVFIILLIPLTMIQFLIDERQNYRNQAVTEVSHSWADSQLIGGPIISVTAEEWIKNKENKSELVPRHFTFLPEHLNIESEVVPEVRRRGIY
jgi:inner membrane protein